MADTRTPQQIVNSLRIASPCDVPWSSMTGDERIRRCAQCDRKVYQVAQMNAQEVVDLIQSSEQMPCLQLWQRADGTVITADCPVGVRRLRSRRQIRLLAAVGFAGLLAGGGAWYHHHRAEALNRCVLPTNYGGIAAPYIDDTVPTASLTPPQDKSATRHRHHHSKVHALDADGTPDHH